MVIIWSWHHIVCMTAAALYVSDAWMTDLLLSSHTLTTAVTVAR